MNTRTVRIARRRSPSLRIHPGSAHPAKTWHRLGRVQLHSGALIPSENFIRLPIGLRLVAPREMNDLHLKQCAARMELDLGRSFSDTIEVIEHGIQPQAD